MMPSVQTKQLNIPMAGPQKIDMMLMLHALCWVMFIYPRAAVVQPQQCI